MQSLVAKGSEYWVFYAEWLGQPKAERWGVWGEELLGCGRSRGARILSCTGHEPIVNSRVMAYDVGAIDGGRDGWMGSTPRALGQGCY